MASKKPASKKTGAPRRKRRELPVMPALETSPLPPPTARGSGHNFLIWFVVILVVGFLFKDKFGCKMFASSIPVQMVGEVRMDGVKGGPYSIASICSVGKDLVAMTDETHTRVLLVDLEGRLKTSFGKKGTSRNEFHHLSGICSDPEGNIYVLDHKLADVFGFHQDGTKFLHVDSSPTGFFYGPRGISYAKGNFAIADTGSCRIVTMDPTGKTVKRWGERGQGPTELAAPTAVLVDAQGRYITLDYDNKRVKIQDENGKVLHLIDFAYKPTAIALDGANHLFVAFADSHFIQELKVDTGRYMGELVVKNPSKDGSYKSVAALCVVGGDKLVAADSNGFRVYQLGK